MCIQWNITQPWKEWNNAICSNMDGPRDYDTKWSKSEKDRYCMTLLTCEIFFKNDINEFFYKTETDSQTENKILVIKGERWVWRIN